MSKKPVLDPDFQEAIDWMKEKTGTQVRAFSGAPYWVHPIQVAILVFKFKKSHRITSLVFAALFHDLVEDGHVTIEEIRERWGELVASLVLELSSDPVKIAEMGKTAYLCQKVMELTEWALVIKLCDRLANVSDFLFAPQSFINKYALETKTILNTLDSRNLTATQLEICASIVDQLYLYKAM